MDQQDNPKDGLVVNASVGRHLALAPVAFAVIEGMTHNVVYENALFRSLKANGQIRIGRQREVDPPPTVADLTPLLNEVVRSKKPVRDAVVEPLTGGAPGWSCSIWPVTDSVDSSTRLVIAVRDLDLIEAAKERQRAIAERLLLTALHDQDLARDADRRNALSQYLATASRDLSLSLDERTTRDAVRRLALPRPGAWCIVDAVESNGALCRLAVIHPDPAKQALARTLEDLGSGRAGEPVEAASVLVEEPRVLTEDSSAALLLAAYGESNLRILREIGFGSLLVVPLIVRARAQGAITFVSREGDLPFSPEEIRLAVDLGTRCAMALDNARLYREADVLRLAAETANKSKSQFLSTVSHELRTPLNAIGGFTELIEMGIEGPVTDRQLVALARIKASQHHLLKLITEILSFVRIESGRMEYRQGPVSLSKALADVAVMLGGAAAERGLTLENYAGDGDVIAWADPDRVRQILVNLVMNAVKYTAVRGRTIGLTCAVVGDTVTASVSDPGPGIPADRFHSIFEPFVQLRATLSERAGGIGLGLPISRDLARAMNGDLTVESTVGVGSRFTLTLPSVAVGARSTTDVVSDARGADGE